MKSRRKHWQAGAAAIALALAAGGAANAQEVVDEIIVTAQKRTQRLIDVPIAVTAVGDEALVRAGVTDLRDLQSMTPSLNITTNNNDATTAAIRIRGIGTTGNNPGFEGAVGTFVDGIYRSRSGVALTEIYDMERVEVLRGPQGTLFGKNTSAGALNLISKAPEFFFGGSATVEGGNYDLVKSQANITGPLAGDKLAGRLAGFIARRDGWQHNTVNGTDASDRNRFGGRGQLLYKPTDDISFRLIADYYQANETGAAAPFLINPVAPIGTVLQAFGARYYLPPRPFEGQYAVNQPLKQNTNDWGISGELNWDLRWATLTNLAGYRQFQNYVNFDSDFTAADYLGRRNETFNVSQFTEELRLAGRADDLGFGHALNWLIGGYYAKEQIADQHAIVFGSQFGALVNALSLGGIPAAFYPAGLGIPSARFSQEGETWAIFTHNTFEITPRLSITGGVRYNSEKKNGSGRFTYADGVPGPGCFLNSGNPTLNGLINNLCPTYNYDGATDESEITGTGSISYKWTDQITTFFAYSHGYKAGGINLDRNAGGFVQHPVTGAVLPSIDPTFDPEFSDNYEIGIKTQFGRTMINIAAFYTEFSDFQLNTFTGLNFAVTNVESVTSKGVEIEVATQPFDWLALTGGGSYVIAKYGDELANSLDPAVSSLAGKIITNAPRLTLNGSATFSQDIPGTPLGSYLRLDGGYYSSLNTGSDLDPEKNQGPVFLMNGRLGLSAHEGTYEIALWARNIFNTSYKTLAIDTPFQPGGFNSWVGEPRTYGIAGRVNF